MAVSENRGTPKSSILIGFSIMNHAFWGTTIFGNPPYCMNLQCFSMLYTTISPTWLLFLVLKSSRNLTRSHIEHPHLKELGHK